MIFLLGEIMPLYSHYMEKKLVYIIIIVLSSYQPSFYIKYIKSNIYLSYDIKTMSNTEYLYLMRLYSLYSLQLPYLIYLRVLRLIGSREAQ